MTKTVIITGANSGLGFNAAKKIAAQGNDFEVVLACRNLEKAQKAKEEIVEVTGNKNILVMQLDTSSLQSVKDFADNYKKSHNKPIYALLCNAGISGIGLDKKQLTPDGFDVVFETNHLGHFLLTNLLLPLMEKEGKILVTASDMHNPPLEEGQKFEWLGVEAIAHPDEDMAQNRLRYSYSKLCNVYFVYELTRKLKEKNSKILVNAFNPGLMKTHLVKGTNEEFYEYCRKFMPERYGDLDNSSSALAQLAYSDDIIYSSGHFYDRSIRPCFTSALSYNEENAKELWEKSEEYVKKYL